jgi:hypothetical protein
MAGDGTSSAETVDLEHETEDGHVADPKDSPLWPADSPAATAHISMLQGIINRLAGNSASCKTWCLTLVAALLSLAGSTHTPVLVTMALVPVVIFGFLDTMYLAQERAYRALYADIVKEMRDKTYGLAHVFDARAEISFRGFCDAFVSWSVFPIYLGLIVAYFAADWTGALKALATVVKSSG